MRSHDLVSVVLMSLLISGCAAPTRSTDVSSKAAVGFAGITVNASPGKFREYFEDVRIGSGKVHTSIVSLGFSKLQPSNDWAPVVGLCLQGEDPKQIRSCLNFSANADGTVTPYQLEITIGDDSKPSSQHFPRKYGIHDELIVRIEAEGGVAKFFVGGERLFESSSLSQPVRLVYFCSSAVCTFDVRQKKLQDTQFEKQ